MFTGIIQSVGIVKRLTKQNKSVLLEVESLELIKEIKIGDSIALNGVCLTATKTTASSFYVDVMNETLKVTSLAKLKVGDRINLELAMTANGKFNGHIVSGHVDGIGTITQVLKDGIAKLYTIRASDQIMNYIIHKGSIAIDGISLTIAKCDKESFSVSIIPHTAKVTTIGSKKTGDIVNLENDLMGKYFEKFLSTLSSNNKGKEGKNNGKI